MEYLSSLHRAHVERRARIASAAIDRKITPTSPQPPPPKPERDWLLVARACETSVEKIRRAVCEHFDISKHLLLSPRRDRNIVRPRMICMYLMREMTGLSFPQIGRRFGGRDHTTAISAARKIAELRTTDPKIDAAVTAIIAKLTPQEELMPDPLRQTISATEAPALFNVSPYLTRWMLYRKFAHGEEIHSPEHNRMDWGKRLQPLLLAAAAEDLRLEVRPNASDVYIRRRSLPGRLGCTRDAEIICPDRGPGALETKCVFDYGVWMRDWGGGKAPPRHHEIQLQVQMYVGDGERSFQWGVLAAWIGGEMHYFERKPILDLWDELDKAAKQFFADVESGTEPDPFGLPVESALLAEAYPTVDGKIESFVDRPDAEALANDVRMLAYHSSERLGHEKAADALKAKVKALLKDAAEGHFVNGIKATIKQSPRAGYTVKPSVTTTVKTWVPQDLASPLAEPSISTKQAPADLLAGG